MVVLSDSDLDWIFGFEIVSEVLYFNEEGGDNNGLLLMYDVKFGVVLEERELEMEWMLLEKVKKVVLEKKERLSGEGKVIKEVVEVWNLVDGEVWRFVRVWVGWG